MHPDKLEEIYENLPKSLYKGISVTTCFIWTILVKNCQGDQSAASWFVGQIFLFSWSKQQGAVKLSTDGAKLCTMKEIVEETI